MLFLRLLLLLQVNLKETSSKFLFAGYHFLQPWLQCFQHPRINWTIQRNMMVVSVHFHMREGTGRHMFTFLVGITLRCWSRTHYNKIRDINTTKKLPSWIFIPHICWVCMWRPTLNCVLLATCSVSKKIHSINIMLAFS